MTTTTAATLPSQYLTFVVGADEYGVGILRTKEIIEYDTLTTVPNAPPFVRGVVNLRGAVVPVVDLAVRFGREPVVLTPRSCIVVVEAQAPHGTALTGILADRVSAVAELPADAIEPPPSFGAGVQADCLHGLGRADKRFVLLLDIDRVLGGAAAPVAEAAGSA
jgi:purine-binding chemotaxis protein CheW